jgi:hypothetical protein
MSHFSVTVCLPADTALDKVEETLNDVLARWDENRECEARRDYEEGGPEDCWWVRSVRRGAEHHRNGTGILPYGGPHSWESGFSKHTEAEQRAEHADDAMWSDRLGEHPTWADVAAAYNAKYHPEDALAVPGEDDGKLDTDRLQYDEESGRAYTWTYRNPDAMWDWWCIGGRWRNSLHAKRGVQASALITSERHYTEQYRKPGDEVKQWASKGLRCDGGPKGLLDFESMRDEAAAQANARYDEWDKICADTPPAHAWAYFIGLKDAGELTIEQARERYGAQPRIVAVRKNEELSWYDDAVEHFGMGREEYVANARRDAVPGYALITLDRQWMAPGRMGWFGMSTDEPGTVDAYKTEANAYLEGLDDDVLIVQIDCHI